MAAVVIELVGVIGAEDGGRAVRAIIYQYSPFHTFLISLMMMVI